MTRLVDSIGGIADSITDTIKVKLDEFETPIIVDVKGIKRAGYDCYAAAQDTSNLCAITIERAGEMVDFGNGIKNTLDSFSRGVGADAFATIQQLVDGDQVKAAMALAAGMDVTALECVEKSVAMIEAMERGVDALPDVIEDRVEDRMEAAVEKGAREGDPEMPNIEADVEELTDRINEIEKVTLFTVMKSGVDAFTSLAAKGAIVKTLFSTIKDFAQSVQEVADAIKNYEVGGMLGKWRDLVKDLWRCLRLSSLIKAFALAIGKLIKFIVRLFKVTAEKLGGIWKALAHAKDVMANCIKYVLEAMRLCDDAKDKSVDLIDTSGEIQRHLETITSLRRSSFNSMVDLLDGDEIRRALELATNMDDILLACVRAVITMVQQVAEGVENLPPVLLTEGFPDNPGMTNDDPAPANVAKDIEALESCRDAIDKADTIGIVMASKEGISKVKDEFGTCRDMVVKSRGFASDCNNTIESFLGVWDLNSARSNLLQMYRLANLGEMIEQWAREIIKLVKANIAVMIAARDRIKNIDFVPDELEEKLQELTRSCCNLLPSF